MTDGSNRTGLPAIVVFEDHTWTGFRPLAASQPVFELRCGLFGTRERVELAGGAGTLRCRRHLADLLPTGSWRVNGPAASAGPELWLSGRLAPRAELVAALLAAARGGDRFAWHDDQGLVAALYGPAEAAAAATAWQEWESGARAAFDAPAWEKGMDAEPGAGQRLYCPSGSDVDRLQALAAALAAACAGTNPALRRIWDLVPATATALAGDLGAGVAAGGWRRRPFGLFAQEAAAAPWGGLSLPTRIGAAQLPAGVWLLGDDLWCAEGVSLAPTTVIDARRGPVVIDRGGDIAPHTLLEGPLYLGPGCRVKAGARLYGESSFGIGNRLAGEIGESTFGDFTNKQHEGFIGHAVLGAWVNLGAMTTCSDLKNNYGSVKVDLGDGLVATGQRFVGLLAGDHVKTAIGTLFNTGTCVGFASNIFGEGMPPKHVPAFSWGGRAGDPPYGLEAAVDTARVVLGRRDCRFVPAHQDLFGVLSRT